MRSGCDKWMWICNAQYQHCELCHLSKVALIVLYNVSDQGASVGESVNASGVWFHHLCLQAMRPSLLIRGLPIKFGPDAGWCVLFGAVYSAYTAGRKHKNSHWNNYQCFSLQKPEWYESREKIVLLVLSLSPMTTILRRFLLQDIPTLSLLLTWLTWSCYQATTLMQALFHISKLCLSPVLSSLSRIVQQHSDDVEETAQHFQSKVKHSHSQTYGAKRFTYWIIVLAILLLYHNNFFNM